MNINYDLLKVFYLVASNGSISKGASILGVSQPAVTQSIQNLEKSLGGQLFTRSKKGVVLTEEGKILYSYVEEGMTLIENGINKFLELKNLESGKIKIGANPVISKYILMPYLREYHELYPNVVVEIINDSTPELVKQLRNGNIDLAILSVPRKEIPSIEIIGFKDIQDVFIANDKYYEKTKELTSIHDLLKLPVIVEKSPSISRAYFDLLLKSKNIECKPSMEVDSQELLIDFVTNGFGLGFATKEYIADELDKNKIFIIDVGQIPKRRVGVAYSKKTTLSISANKLIELIKNEKE